MTLRNRTLGNASLTLLGAALISLVIFPCAVFAFPLEKFEHQLEVTCAADPSCARSVRAKTTLGAYTGIWVRGGGETRSTLSVAKGVLAVHVTGSVLRGIQLSWDSDTYADQLSSAGLRCIDMRHHGGSAIMIKDFKLDGVCGEGEAERACPPFVIETRIYDSADPTGQTYSASILRRSNGRETQDLIIPFSNFNRKGLRGAGRLACAGAVSINLRMDGYRDVTLSAGPIFTNSTDPFEALVLTPTPTPNLATPTSVESASEISTHAPTTTLTIAPTAASVTETSAPQRLTNTTMESQEAPHAPSVIEVVVAPLNSPNPRREEEEEETVYGAIIAE